MSNPRPPESVSEQEEIIFLKNQLATEALRNSNLENESKYVMSEYNLLTAHWEKDRKTIDKLNVKITRLEAEIVKMKPAFISRTCHTQELQSKEKQISLLVAELKKASDLIAEQRAELNGEFLPSKPCPVKLKKPKVMIDLTEDQKQKPQKRKESPNANPQESGQLALPKKQKHDSSSLNSSSHSFLSQENVPFTSVQSMTGLLNPQHHTGLTEQFYFPVQEQLSVLKSSQLVQPQMCLNQELSMGITKDSRGVAQRFFQPSKSVEIPSDALFKDPQGHSSSSSSSDNYFGF